MIALGAWLKEIVMMVLLAAFADMLLPTKAMQKYVKTVLGLAIIAVLVQPVLPFLHPNWASEVSQLATSELEQGGQGVSGSTNLTTTDYAHTLKDETQNVADKMVEQQLISALPTQFRSTVVSTVVTGAALGTRHVHVEIFCVAGTSLSKQIADWATNLLGLENGQVVIKS